MRRRSKLSPVAMQAQPQLPWPLATLRVARCEANGPSGADGQAVNVPPPHGLGPASQAICEGGLDGTPLAITSGYAAEPGRI